MNSHTLNINGGIMTFEVPKVMGIINVTPDSFYAGSRSFSADDVTVRAETMLADGVDIFDIGGYSSRPGAGDVSEDEEMRRLSFGFETLRRVAPDTPVSVDTFRASVARHCVENFGVEIINDISGGTLDPAMWQTVADLKAAYVLMHMRGTPADMQNFTQYGNVVADVLSDLSQKVAELRQLGVANIIVDPGFGFSKTTEQNFQLLASLRVFQELGCPILAGLSRKSMICKTLGITPGDASIGTAAANTAALLNGADILRVHDVKEARQCVAIVSELRGCLIRKCSKENHHD